MSNESIGKTIVVALGVCIVWSLLVSTAAVTLKPRQEMNRKLDKLKNVLIAGDLLVKDKSIEEIFGEKITSRVVEIETGEFLPAEKQIGLLDPEDYNIKRVAADGELGVAIPADKDQARIRRKPKFVQIYFVRDADLTSKIILPIYGQGLWSKLYGFVALDRDLQTIQGFTFYEHGETPGLGGEVDNPSWKAQWKGKMAFDDENNLRIQVLKGKVDTSRSEAIYQVDGLSGSTLTTNGINNLVRFWLGDQGYGPFLNKLREEGIDG
jgi:Na+-transporting NADH:ubiquinone oxidoreductase subunit C